MSRTRIAFVLLLAAALSIASSCVTGTAKMVIPDNDACDPLCAVAVAGFPFPFIADDLGISPVGSASLSGAVLGLDRLLPDKLLLTFLCWTLASAALAALADRSSRERT